LAVLKKKSLDVNLIS